MNLIHEVSARRVLPSLEECRSIRETAGVTLRRMAQELEVEPSTLMRWENGQTHPRPQALIRYAALLAELKREMTS